MRALAYDNLWNLAEGSLWETYDYNDLFTMQDSNFVAALLRLSTAANTCKLPVSNPASKLRRMSNHSHLVVACLGSFGKLTKPMHTTPYTYSPVAGDARYGICRSEMTRSKA